MSSPINLLIYQLLFLLSSFSCVAFALPDDHHNPQIGNSKRNKVSIVEERSGRNVTVLEHAATGMTLDFVTNSGICETTPGVNQYSGYISLEPDQHTWFWLAPLSWLLFLFPSFSPPLPPSYKWPPTNS